MMKVETIGNNINNYKVLNYSIKRDSKHIINLWNDEVGHIFPINKKMLDQNINSSKYLDIECSFVVYDGKKLIGFILGKIYDNNKTGHANFACPVYRYSSSLSTSFFFESS